MDSHVTFPLCYIVKQQIAERTHSQARKLLKSLHLREAWNFMKRSLDMAIYGARMAGHYTKAVLAYDT